jgi:hypothetical protein
MEVLYHLQHRIVKDCPCMCTNLPSKVVNDLALHMRNIALFQLVINWFPGKRVLKTRSRHILKKEIPTSGKRAMIPSPHVIHYF